MIQLSRSSTEQRVLNPRGSLCVSKLSLSVHTDQRYLLSTMKAAIILLSCLALAVNAARPLDDGFAGRDLLSANLGGFRHPNPSNPYSISTQGCPNAIGFGDYKAFALPQHKILAGKIQFYNHGAKAYRIHDAGFFLHPTRGNFAPVRGELRCPNLFISANGALNCGFVAPASQPLAFNSFQPFFTPNNVDSPCLCNKPLTVVPFVGGPASASAQASASAANGPANSLASALGQAFGSAGYSQAISKANAYRGNALGLAEAICDTVFGPSTAEALSNAEAKGWGNAAANAKSAATSWGSWSDAKGLAIGTAWNGQAAANSDTQADAYGSGASAANKAVANGKYGATATGSGSATAQGGPAIATSGTAANAGCGAATASNQAGALSTQGAIADGSAQANTGCGPAKAVSSTGAVVTGQGSFGPAVATDKASASGTTADAKSQAAAVNNGNGPALADSKAEAHGVYEKSASSKAVAQAANGPAVARATSVSG